MQACAALAGRNGLFDMVNHQRAVGQPRELVVKCQLVDLLLLKHQRGYILGYHNIAHVLAMAVIEHFAYRLDKVRFSVCADVNNAGSR